MDEETTDLVKEAVTWTKGRAEAVQKEGRFVLEVAPMGFVDGM